MILGTRVIGVGIRCRVRRVVHRSAKANFVEIMTISVIMILAFLFALIASF